MPVLIKPNNFDAEVLQPDLPVLVDFFGERCVPCRMQRPILIELGEEYTGQLKVCMFNTDQEAQETEAEYMEKFRIITKYNVMHLPTLLLFVGGEVRRALVGLHTKQDLLQIFAEEGLALQPGKRDQPGTDDGE